MRTETDIGGHCFRLSASPHHHSFYETIPLRLLPAVNTTSGVAVGQWVVKASNKAQSGFTTAGGTNLAEAGTLSMEFSSVTHLTGDA